MKNLQRNNASDPLYVQVADILRQQIRDGHWHDGDPIPTEKELCAQYNIARGTLRQALQMLENEGYLRREQGRGTFIQRIQVKEPEGHGRHLAFVVPYIRDSSVSSILVGFQQVAEEAGYSVIFNHVNNDLHQQQDVLQKLVQQGVMGIALYPVDSEGLTGIDRLVRASYPIVLVDRYLKRLSTDYVMSNHFGGSLKGTHYLIDQGHRRVGFATWFSPAVSMEHRLMGYMQALRERDIPMDESLVCRVQGYPTIDHSTLVKYLSRPDRPTAIFAANDQIAIALYRAAALVGLQIPQDVSVMGFDDLDISPHLEPSLTTLAQPFNQIGKEAARILLSRIQGETFPLLQVTLAAHIIVRNSCCEWQGDKVTAQD